MRQVQLVKTKTTKSKQQQQQQKRKKERRKKERRKCWFTWLSEVVQMDMPSDNPVNNNKYSYWHSKGLPQKQSSTSFCCAAFPMLTWVSFNGWSPSQTKSSSVSYSEPELSDPELLSLPESESDGTSRFNDQARLCSIMQTKFTLHAFAGCKWSLWRQRHLLFRIATALFRDEWATLWWRL